MNRKLPAVAVLALAIVVDTHALAAVTVKQIAGNVYQNIYGIAVDKTGIYVTGSTTAVRDFDGDYTTGTVGIIPLAGGAVTTLYDKTNYPTQSGHVAPMQIATDGNGTLYWADPDAGPSTGAAYYQASGTGSGATQFFGTCCGASVLPGDGIGTAFAGGLVYFSDGDGARMGYFPSLSTSPVQIGPTQYTPDFSTEAYPMIAVSAGKIFIAQSGQQWSGASDGSGLPAIYSRAPTVKSAIQWIATNGTGGFHTINTTIANPQGIAAAGNTLFVTTRHAVYEVNGLNGSVVGSYSDARFLDLRGCAFYQNALYVADAQNVYGAFSGGVSTATKDKPGIVWKLTD